MRRFPSSPFHRAQWSIDLSDRAMARVSAVHRKHSPCRFHAASLGWGWTSAAVALVAFTSSAALSQEQTPPQVTEEAVLVLKEDVHWQSCSPEDAKPEEKCEYYVLFGDESEGPHGEYVRLPKGCGLGKHWETTPMHLVGLEGEFIYTFEDGTEMSVTPGTYAFVPENKVHSERCGEDGALFYLYVEKPLNMHMVEE